MPLWRQHLSLVKGRVHCKRGDFANKIDCERTRCSAAENKKQLSFESSIITAVSAKAKHCSVQINSCHLYTDANSQTVEVKLETGGNSTTPVGLQPITPVMHGGHLSNYYPGSNPACVPTVVTT